MNPKTAAKWIEAHQWLSKYPGAPAVLAQEAAKRFKMALRTATPAKPKIRLPRGAKSFQPTLPKLKKELDRVFSIFIRRRGMSDAGITHCVTCGRTGHWTEMDAGHYVPRQDMATRWDERNVHTQCKSCNGFRGGEPEKMAEYINLTYCVLTARALRALSKQKFRPTRQWYEQQIAKYGSANG